MLSSLDEVKFMFTLPFLISEQQYHLKFWSDFSIAEFCYNYQLLFTKSEALKCVRTTLDKINEI